jgi:phage baseplate assembly protein W
MAINLNIAKPNKEIENSTKRGYIYKDVNLDLVYGYTTNGELFSSNEKKDLKAIYDEAAILNSLKNILTTSPGEKLLNPLFGLDLRDYLFESVTETKGYFLADEILTGLPLQEERIVVNFVDVVVNPDDQEYIINLDIGIPTLNIPSISLRGVLNNDGYIFT